jgi:hypothetical protein
MNPVGVPHSTNNVRCANLQAQSGEYMACMENLPLAQPGTRASSGGGFFGRFRGGSASSGAGQPADRSPSRTPMSGSGIAPSSGY